MSRRTRILIRGYRAFKINHNARTFIRDRILFGILAELHSRASLVDRDRRRNARLRQLLLDQNRSGDRLRMQAYRH